MPDDDKTKKAPDDGKGVPKPDPSPTFTGGHKAVLEVNFTYRTEADPESESVKTFLKAIGEFSQGRSVPLPPADKK